MIYNFCTLFDSGYLDKGLVTYYSLKAHCQNFHIYMVAFDEIAYKCLNKLQLECCTVLYINDIENDELRKVKKERSRAEYCWTCASYITLYILENMSVDNCTYIDADLMFFSNPEKLIDELLNSGDSVLIVGHNFPETKKYQRISKEYGKYCVQFNTFLNDSRGKCVLREWVFNCLQQCSEENDGKTFGDQKYLDDWEQDYEGIHVLKHKGGGIAPWNIGKYILEESGKDLLIRERNAREVFPVIFFHYHDFREGKKILDMSSVRRHKNVDMNLLYIIYGTYIYELERVRNILDNTCDWHGKIEKKKKKISLQNLILNFYNYILFVFQIIGGGWRDFVFMKDIKKYARGRSDESIS